MRNVGKHAADSNQFVSSGGDQTPNRKGAAASKRKNTQQAAAH